VLSVRPPTPPRLPAHDRAPQLNRLRNGSAGLSRGPADDTDDATILPLPGV